MTDNTPPETGSADSERAVTEDKIRKLGESLPDMSFVQFVPLALKPTPLEEMRGTSEALGLRVRVKRDDLTGSHLSGNKVRKLEYLMRHALACDATHIVTTGGIQSNHCRATALTARKLGMTPVLLLRTPTGRLDDLPSPATGNVFLNLLAGADIRTCTPQEYGDRDARMAAIADELREQGHRPYIIPEGGSNALGALGYVACALEIAAQAGPALPATVVCAVGSGGTFAGLALGFKHLNLGVRVIGIPVCDDANYFRQRITAIADDACTRFGLTRLEPQDIVLVDGFQGRGYALNTPEELALIRDVARRDGLIVDPVYSGKAFRALTHIAQEQTARLGGDTVFLHTGGIFGLLAKSKEFEGLL